MRKVLIITMGESTGRSFFNQLNDLLGDSIEFRRITIDQPINYEPYDYCVFSTQYVFNFVYAKGPIGKPYSVVSRVVDHTRILKMFHIAAGSKVLLVNDIELSALETIDRLINIGLDHVEYVPYFPGCGITDFSVFEIAVTPGEADFIPKEITNYLDIGSRIISIGSIQEMIIKLDFDSEAVQNLTSGYVRDIVTIMKEIELNRVKLVESQLYVSKTIDSLELGVIGFNSSGVIERVNNKIERILSRKSKEIIDYSINDILEEVSFPFETNDNITMDIFGRLYLCQIHSFRIKNEDNYILSLELVNDVRLKDIRLKKLNEQKRQLLTFDNYLTVNSENIKTLEQAKKFASSDAQILIEGENGTGKEVLAQAIHMHSGRKNDVFMPINITAISETLLESELFGYEPGAFTGADRNGKIGIFERAEGGTVFIDEIGDAPLPIQARLLRVIQEKKIRRVGGHQEVIIDVRIISATNKKLREMVKEGTFRQDLYFRLNVLPIRTIPLRERRNDIIYLLDIFIRSKLQTNMNSLEDVFAASTMGYLENYAWPGNVRELLNLCEYVSYTYSGERITINDLPYYLREETSIKYPLDYLEYKVLLVIDSEGIVGRRRIVEKMSEGNVEITEGKVRTIIKQLISQNIIYVVGRKGVELTVFGKDLINNYKNKTMWE